MSGHSSAQTLLGRVQLCSQAGQASFRASASSPGKSDQGTGTQRLLGCTIAGGKVDEGDKGGGVVAAVDGPDVGELAEGLSGTGASKTGANEQPAKLPTIAANAQHERSRGVKRNGTWIMVLILLEALLALVLFVVIVWWTMFSGRNKGELPPAKPAKPSKPAEPDDKKP
jgi:hypothetical protein